MNLVQKIFQILREDKQLIKRLSAAFIGRTQLGRILKIKIQVQDFQIFFHPTGLCSVFWYNPNARSDDYQFLKDFLKPGDLYVDIGANIGVTVIPAAKSVGNHGKVIAFEPHPKISSYLQENIALNKLTNVELHNCALGNTRGEVYFTNYQKDEMNQISFSSANALRVPSILLDDIGSKLEHIPLLKLDVEGYEKFVIEGGKETFNKAICVYFEVCEPNFQNFGYQTTDLLKSIEPLGFKLFKKNEQAKELIPIDSQYTPSPDLPYENLFAIKNVDEFINRTKWQVQS